MKTAESKVEQSELDTGSEGMWLSLDAIWSLWVKLVTSKPWIVTDSNQWEHRTPELGTFDSI